MEQYYQTHSEWYLEHSLKILKKNFKKKEVLKSKFGDVEMKCNKCKKEFEQGKAKRELCYRCFTAQMDYNYFCKVCGQSTVRGSDVCGQICDEILDEQMNKARSQN